jgi:hypothetical protein
MSGCVDDLGGLLMAAYHQSLEVRGRLRRRFVTRAARCELQRRHAGTIDGLALKRAGEINRPPLRKTLNPVKQTLEEQQENKE